MFKEKNKYLTFTLKEQVYNIIKNDILNGVIKPGSWLQENELASQLKVSRSPIREALKELAGEGLLDNIPNKGVFVKELTRKDIIDIFELRIILEKYSIEKTTEHITEYSGNILKEIMQRLEAAFKKKNVKLYTNIDAELHNTIIYMSENKLVYEVNEKVFSLLQPFRSMSLNSKKRFEVSLNEHKNIVEALIKKDADTAWKWDLIHLNLAKDEILKNMLSPEINDSQVKTSTKKL
jgi:DNA-binding GntR family transcriptional regulator